MNYTIFEIGNQPAFFNPESVNRVWPRRFNEGEKKYVLAILPAKGKE